MTDLGIPSLPPLVNGNVYGHLTVTIDEVLWCCKCPCEVFVLLQWWGDTETVTLRPTDISKYPESSKDNSSVTYNISTSLALFQSYLKQCNKLKLLLINCMTKEVVGHVDVNNLHKLIIEIQYQKYFPIIKSTGTRIGELRVDFELSMNSIRDENSSKRMRKRSRRKNKNVHSPLLSSDEVEKTIQSKKGCNTCSDHTKPLNRPTPGGNKLNSDLPKSPSTQVPPNTERSDSSDSVLLNVIEKGKKLRDAMVLSVLEDCEADLGEKLLLKMDDVDKGNISGYKSMKTQKNGEAITPREEQLIHDLLSGKPLKEEDEMHVVNILHADIQETMTKHKFNMKNKPKTKDHQTKKHGQQKVQRPLPESNSHSSSASSSCSSSDPLSMTQSNSNPVSEATKNLMKKINCFRLTVDSLTLTSAGWKKVNQAVDNKTKNCEAVPPPGATYFVECHFLDDSPRTQAHTWKSSPLRFCSRKQIENVVYFGQSSVHVLRDSFSPPTTQKELAAARCVVSWRHLQQRVPAVLGELSLGCALPSSGLEATLNLPITGSGTGVVLGHVKLTLQLGRDKLYFGDNLHEDSQNKSQEHRRSEDEKITVGTKEIPLNVKDLYNRSELPFASSQSYSGLDCTNTSAKIVSQDLDREQNLLPNFAHIPVCTNCGQNMVLTNIQISPASTLCVCCSKLLSHHHQGQFTDSNYKISIPKNFASKEQRHHEFLLRIDTVVGLPLFAGIQEDLSCYVDYKFPEISSGLKAEMGKCETTSRVVSCSPQPELSSMAVHRLSLPVVLPLSPLLAACCPGLTLRLWLRYYKPCPRDHMVAMALLPMDELCLMELEFDKKQQKTAVIKVLELPLALVPSSVTTPFQNCQNHGVVRVTVTYSNHIAAASSSRDHPPTAKQTSFPTERQNETTKYETDLDFREVVAENSQKAVASQSTHVVPRTECNLEDSKPKLYHEQKKGSTTPIDALLKEITAQDDKFSEGELKAVKNRFWTGPFGKEDDKQKKDDENEEKEKCDSTKSQLLPNRVLQKGSPIPNSLCVFGNTSQNHPTPPEYSQPVMKEDFDILAESLEHRFNKLQSDLLKERQKELGEVDNIVIETRKLGGLMNDNDDLLSFHSLSSNSSMDSLPFILGPPADFKDIQNTVVFSKAKKPFSDSLSDKSVSDTISGFLKEENTVENLGSNESFEGGKRKVETVKPKTFKAKIKIDRAVNLKAVKAPSNGKKGKVPPSTWVTFGTGDCCEQNCGTGSLVCSGRRFTTPVARRNYNPIWNLSWDIDLPVDYLLQVNKRLVFRVYEENLDVGFGFASANLSILTSGLPSLSSWLSINDLAGACKGQIKVVVTPLEDLSQYQECSVFDAEDDEFEEVKEENPETETSSQNNRRESVSFVASETEVYVNDGETSAALDREVEQLTKSPVHEEDALDGEDLLSVDDVISDYKNTLENNFRNEMAGLENLIKFLRVGSMSNELSFLRATENKENLSVNPSSLRSHSETRTGPLPDTGGKFATDKTASVNNQPSNQNCQRDRVLIDASTETQSRDEIPSSSQESGEDILTKLLQQISMFQLPTVKITDNTCQTISPETKETCTETNVDNQTKPMVDKTVHMKDACTETDDISDQQSSKRGVGEQTQVQTVSETSKSPHVCGELGSVLLQHFLTCKPAPVKVTDSACQTTQDRSSTVNSSGVFTRSQPSDISTDILIDNFPSSTVLPDVNAEWVLNEGAQTNTERLIIIDNNIKDLERFLKENLILTERDEIPPADSNEGSSCGSLNSIFDSIQPVRESSSSDVESLGSYSQAVVPRETPDGGNPSTVPDSTDPGNTVNTGTSLKRQGTFVIEKLKDSSEELNTLKESEGKDAA